MTPAVRRRIAVLGLITITVYGGWYYSFGVMLDPIIADTGWSETLLATVFGASAFLAAGGSLLGGWLLDRLGSRVVFAVAAVVGSGCFLVASRTQSAGVFAVSAALGGGVLAALAFYHVTQTVAVRLSPSDSDRAIANLTIWGAFASAVFIPLTAFLVSRYEWRITLRFIAVATFLALLAGVVTIDTGRRKERPEGSVSLNESLRESPARRLLAGQLMAGLGVGTILVYQVPAMTAAGLTLAAASFWAGFRGFAQLGGRLPLMSLVRRLGVAGSLRIAYMAIAVGCLFLAFAGTPWLAAGYAIVAGFGVGAVSPLIGMHSRNVFGEASLGTALGLVSLVFLLASATGPILAALLAETTGSRSLPVMVSSIIVLGAAVVTKPTD